jgi:hypothetical protein
MRTLQRLYLVGWLGFRAAVPATLLVSALGASLVACDDENDPKTWAKRLDDPAQRAPAIKRLANFFDDTMTRANKNKSDERVKALMDVAVEPLTKQYTSATLDEKTRKDLIKLLSEMADPRSAPAFAKAFNDYEAGKSDDDVKYASEAVMRLSKEGKLTDQGLIDALWACFAKFQPSKANKSINLLKNLREAVLAVKHPSYGPKAVEKLAQPIQRPDDPEEQLDKIQFGQLVAVQIISALKYGGAARALVTALLTPAKAALTAPITKALMEIPKEAEPVLLAAAKGGDAELDKLAKENPEASHVPKLAQALAFLSRPAGKDAVIDMTANAANDANRALVATRALVHFPSDKKLTDAFLAAYGKTSAEASIQGYGNAKALWAESASQTYDPALVDWLLKEAGALKGEAGAAFPPAALPSAIKLMPADKVKAVEEAINKALITPKEKTNLTASFKAAAEVTEKCKQDAACYLAKLDTPVPSSPPAARMGHIKACYMAAIYGNAETRKALVAKLEKVKDGIVRLALAEAIDHLAPQGDAATADALDKIVAADVASGNAELIANDDAVVKTALKLRSRANP